MNVTIPMKNHKILVEKARRDAYHEGYKQGRFDEFIESQYGREDHDIIPVIRCKDCRYYDHGENPSESWSICTTHINRYFQTCAENYCAWAERKEE